MNNSSTKSKSILIIEDQLPLLEAIMTQFERSHFRVLTARTVDQAMDIIHGSEEIDAIWLDHYLLGKEDGLDFVSKLKADEGRAGKIPIFVVSNTASPEKVHSYLQLGVKKYYVKSEHRLDEIMLSIRQHLDHPEG